ncbi:MAG: hypothetical protein ACJ8C4_18640 [Gemmataceae bacterium]
MSMGPQQGPLDKMFRDTNMVILIIFALCCSLIALILSIICFTTAKDPEAKAKAQTVLIVSGVVMAIGIVGQFLGIFNSLMIRGR